METKTGKLKKGGSGKYPRKGIFDVHKYDRWEIVPDSGQDIAGILLVDKDTSLTLVSGTSTITISES
jgi:hypothetical protein